MRNTLIALSLLLVPAVALAQNSPPVADAGPLQTIYLGDTITLHGTAVDPDGDPIVDWQWEVISAPVGSTYDLAFVDTPDPIFDADTVGDYVITLIARDYYAWSDPAYTAVTVVQNQPPTAVASATPLSGPAPLLVSFDATASFDPEGKALLYQWIFGDGASGTGSTPDHEYVIPGPYTATLKVIDDGGVADFDSVDILVTAPNNPPEATPTATPNEGPAPLVVQFHANASDPDGDSLTYAWDFGDPGSTGNTSILADPAHTYASPGTYVASLTVSDGIHEVSASVAVLVAVGKPLSTSRASVVGWELGGGDKATISYWGDVDLPAPGADDVISLTFDGIKLFSKRFGQFDPGINLNEYLFVQRWVLVRIDLDSQTIYVEMRKANIKRFDNFDGVDVELLWGSNIAVDQFVMTPISDVSWVFERSTE